MVLATAIVVVCTFELYTALHTRGFRPAALIGLLGAITIVPLAYDRAEFAFPFVFALVTIFTLLWFVFEVVHTRPMVNVAVTIGGFMYTAGLGAFAGLLLTSANGVGLVLGVALPVIAYDVFGYFIGSQFGKSRLAPAISPNKTVEGLIGGMTGSIIVAVLIVKQIHPWGGLGHALALGRHGRGDGAARRPRRVDAQARPRDQGLRHDPARARRRARPLRRPALLPPGGLLPRAGAEDRLSERRRIALLGSTGSIGTQALDVIRAPPRRLRGRRRSPPAATPTLLAAQAAEFGVPADRALLAGDRPEVLAELAALDDVDVVLNARRRLRGSARHARARCGAGKRLALANKESLIAGGPVVNAVRRAGGGEIVPVDSEHSAVYQALRGGRGRRGRVASCSPRAADRSAVARAPSSSGSPIDDALQHPTWSMGAEDHDRLARRS